MSEKQVACTLVSIYLDSTWLEHAIENKQYKNFRLLIQTYVQSRFSRDRSGTSFSTTFWVWFFKKNASKVIFVILCYKVITDQFPVSNWLYFLRYCAK